MKSAFWLLKSIIAIPIMAVMFPSGILFFSSFWVFGKLGEWGEA